MVALPISLGVGSNPQKFGHAGNARHINCYLEPMGADAKSEKILIGSDGLASFATVESTGIRAMLAVGPFLYVVSGRQVYRVDIHGSVRALGGIPTEGTVSMARNRRAVPQIGIVSDGLFFVIDTGTAALTQVIDVDLPPAVSLSMLDGYGILPVNNSRWFITALDDFTQVDALDFASAESNPDEIVTSSTRESEVVLFGTASIEWWQNVGDADFAFRRSQSAEIGCLSAASVARVERTLMWIAHDGTVRVMEGYGGKRVSTYAVERAIADVEASTITSTSWWARGHQFYAMSCPSWTWVYDLSTGAWHERHSYGLDRWRVSTVSRFGHYSIAGDYVTGDLYTMTPDANTEGASPLIMTVQTAPIHAFPQRLIFDALHVDLVPGVGTNVTASQDVDPSMMVSWSDDGGHSWSNEQIIGMGRLGDTKRRAIARRLGRTTTHGRTFKLSVSADVARGFIGAAIEARKIA